MYLLRPEVTPRVGAPMGSWGCGSNSSRIAGGSRSCGEVAILASADAFAKATKRQQHVATVRDVAASPGR